MLTFEQVIEMFRDYLSLDNKLELVLTKRGYLRIIWAGNFPRCEDGYLCQTPEELFDRLLADCENFHEFNLTKGKREPTPEDTAQAKELCRPYLEKRNEVEGASP